MQDHDLSPAEKRLRLLKQGKKGLIHLIFSRTGIMTLLILLQLGLMLLMVLRFQDYQVHYYGCWRPWWACCCTPMSTPTWVTGR